MKDLKISKGLLSEVLKTNRFTCDNIYGNIACLRDGNGGGWDYNIYEFAFRCKEWAYKQCYEIISYTEGCKIYQTQIGEIIKEFYADSEQHAIIKACEWILNNK